MLNAHAERKSVLEVRRGRGMGGARKGHKTGARGREE